MEGKKKPSFDFSICINCGVCAQACPFSCIEMSVGCFDKFKNLFPKVRDEVCTGCAFCTRECPVEAITMV